MRRRYVSRRSHRATGDLGPAHRHRRDPAAAGLRSQRGALRCAAIGARAQNRLRDRGHRRPLANQNQPDGRTGEDAPHGSARDSGRAARNAAGDGRHDRAKRPGASPQIYRNLRRNRHRADQAGWHGQGRNRDRHRARVEHSHPLRGNRREGGRSAAVRRRKIHRLAFRKMTAAEQETDARYLREVLDLARKGDAQTSPNPLVGAVLVCDGQVVGSGFHTWTGVKHAEILALDEAGERARGATLYINLEPHGYQGRTPPCTAALIEAGVARVVAALEDPNPLVAGDGMRQLRAAGIRTEIAAGFSAEAEKLNEAFAHFMRTRLPLVTLKTALTLDGKIAAPADNRGWITSDKARADVQQLRHRSDAILTGIGTVLADDCLLTDRTSLPRSRPLLRIVLDSRLRLPVESQMVRSAADDVLVVGTSAAPAERRKALESHGVRVLVLDGRDGRADFKAA